MRPDERLLLAVAAGASVCSAAGTLQLPWTTDARVNERGFDRTYGPDGPWQAVAVFPGDFGDTRGDLPGVPVPMWPSGSDTSEVPAAEGNYSAEDSSTAVETGAMRGNTDTWFSSAFLNISSMGSDYFDTMALPEKIDYRSRLSVNASVVAMEYSSMPGDRPVNVSVGILGLGPNSDRGESEDFISKDDFPSILEQLKSDDEIGSASFGFHVGSAALEQPGSLILGGYERNRVIGQAGAFTLIDEMPFVPLCDVTLGVETGGSPFDSPDPISVYRGTPDDGTPAADIAREYGAKKGSAMMIPNAAAPYIYLPPGTCEEAAKHLPVNHDEDLDLYLWDTSDPQFERIVTSPAYLAFVLSDRSATNITIKVPFALLNLTLTEPLADEPTAYFPCRSMRSDYGFWMLGRAFLQAALMVVNFDSKLLFLAQAPGPGLEQSVTRELADSDEALEGLAEGKFAESWAATWTALPGGEEDGAGGKLAGGAIAGISVGSVAGVAGVGLAAFFLLRRRKRKVDGAEEQPASKASSVDGGAIETQGTPVHEMEVTNPQTPELDSPEAVHEAPGRLVAAELPASVARES